MTDPNWIEEEEVPDLVEGDAAVTMTEDVAVVDDAAVPYLVDDSNAAVMVWVTAVGILTVAAEVMYEDDTV